MPEGKNTQSAIEFLKTSAKCKITIYKTGDGFMWNEYSFHGLISKRYVAQLIACAGHLYLLHHDGGESLVDDLAEPLLEVVQHLRHGGTLGTEIGFKGNSAPLPTLRK